MRAGHHNQSKSCCKGQPATDTVDAREGVGYLGPELYIKDVRTVIRMQKVDSNIIDDGSKVPASSKMLPPHQASLIHHDNINIAR